MKPEQITEFDAFSGGAPGRVGTAVSGTTVYRGQPTDLQGNRSASYTLFWTGTPTGTFVMQASNRTRRDDTTDADWIDVVLDKPIVQPAGSASKDYVDLTDWPFRFVRPKYTNASGAGNIFADFQGKE